jgi:protein involved in polysaccharide export with SLBB domain
MIKNRLLLCVWFMVLSPLVLFSQTGSNLDIEMSSKLQQALSSPDYRVTPGDIFTLAYAVGTTQVEYTVLVDSTYRIRVANLGVVDASGRTLSQVKSQVETIVSNNYPMSGVQFVLIQPAVFSVYINGEVNAAMSVPAWGLDRVSSVLSAEYLTGFSSLRKVTVRSVNGQTREYDLFKAQRFGDMSQNPYVRPGDIITVNRIDRAVTINGAVERPGRYQLLDGENLKELIEIYGSGFTPVADQTRLELVRLVNSVEISGDKIFLSESDLTGNYALEDYDEITVPVITRLQPVIFIEGAIGVGSGAIPTVSTRVTVSFIRGENYASLIRRYSDWFSAVSDTRNAYIVRGNEHISINLNPMLYDSSFRSEVFVQENDTLIIPFRQYFVTVAGAVRVPGRYPYIPDRDWEYYIALAGGFIPGQNASQSIRITDLNGKQLKKTDIITPETVITANTNDFLFYFNQYAPVITTVLSIITTLLALQATLSR